MFTPAPLFGIKKIVLTFTANANNVDMFQAAGSPVKPVIVVAKINPGVVIGSASIATPAFTTGTGWPAESKLFLVNDGQIQGKGGRGGNGGSATAPASCSSPSASQGAKGENGGVGLNAQFAISVTNNNLINGGGGGGGGAGGGAGQVHEVDKSGQCTGSQIAWAIGGAGGGGGQGGGAGGTRGTGNGGGEVCDSNGTGTFFGACPSSGSAGTNSDRGAGGPATQISGFSRFLRQNGGGAGGLAGNNGSNGGTAQAGSGDFDVTSLRGSLGGGTGGAAVTGNSFITWIAEGTRNGAIT